MVVIFVFKPANKFSLATPLPGCESEVRSTQIEVADYMKAKLYIEGKNNKDILTISLVNISQPLRRF